MRIYYICMYYILYNTYTAKAITTVVFIISHCIFYKTSNNYLPSYRYTDFLHLLYYIGRVIKTLILMTCNQYSKMNFKSNEHVFFLSVHMYKTYYHRIIFFFFMKYTKYNLLYIEFLASSIIL